MKFSKNGIIEGGQGTETVPAAMQDLMVDFTKTYYEHFIPATNH
jgi:dynactin 5